MNKSMNVIDQIDALAGKATAAPWPIKSWHHGDSTGHDIRLDRWISIDGYSAESEPNAHLIVELRNAWPLISKALRAAEKIRIEDHREGGGLIDGTVTIGGDQADIRELRESLRALGVGA